MPYIEIHVKNNIDPSWSDWLQGMVIQPVSPQESCLSSNVPDNSAIYGILSSLGSLGLTLISVVVTEKNENPELSTLTGENHPRSRPVSSPLDEKDQGEGKEQ
jgi:hypothetical protein